MKLLSKISVALLLSTAFAYAADDPFASYYTNTLVYTSPDKIVAKVLPSKDGTWTATSTDPKNPTSHGNWARLGGWLCSNSAATPKSKPWCRKAEGHAVGDKWTEVQPDKSIEQIELVAGR